jgi:hypothetical protein
MTKDTREVYISCPNGHNKTYTVDEFNKKSGGLLDNKNLSVVGPIKGRTLQCDECNDLVRNGHGYTKVEVKVLTTYTCACGESITEIGGGGPSRPCPRYEDYGI